MLSAEFRCSWRAAAAALVLWTTFSVSGLLAGPIVTTRSGQIEGSRRTYKLQFYEEFLGIPFAAPPVGELRWQRPQPVTPWEGVRSAVDFGQHCTQFIAPLYALIGMKGSSGEDCLYVNVWVPHGVEANQGRQLPVMVWIYGGAFFFGTGAMYPGEALALHGDVIVVNFNYRVSTLGWLSTGDSALPGNYGLWDVEAALVWVQENIAAFNGDPTRVTVFGQSAGGALTSHAVISPKTRGLLQNAIAISGASSGFFGTQYRPLRTAVMLANIFQCDDVQTSSDIVDCLKHINTHVLDILGVAGHIAAEQRLPSWAPVVDGDILPMSPADCFLNGYGRDVNFITGYAYHDAANFVMLNPIGIPSLGDSLNWAATPEAWEATMKLIVGGTLNREMLIADIVAKYPELDTADNFTRTVETTLAMTDWWFGSGSNWEASVRARNPATSGSTYQYQFHHRQSFQVGYAPWVNGTHVDDVYSYLGEPFMDLFRRLYLKADFDDVDKEVSSRLMSYFSNFAHTGNPNTGSHPVPVEWTEFDPELQNYLFEAPTFSVEQYDAEKLDKFQYWTDFPNKAEYAPDPTFPLPTGGSGGRKLSESDIERGVEQLRSLLTRLAGRNQEVIATINANIDDAVAERRRHLLRNRK